MPRRGENIYKRKDGRWEGRYIKEHVNGKIHYGYVFARTYKEVKNKLIQSMESVQEETKGISVPMKNTYDIYFEIAADEWLTFLKPHLKDSSVVKYTNILQSYLFPQFKGRLVNTITRKEVIDYGNELLLSGGSYKKGLSPRTVSAIVSVMKRILTFASQEKGCSVADIKNVTVKQKSKSLRILSLEEQRKLSDYLCNNLTLCNLGILICLYTGLRVGEICALKWEDISFTEKYLYVHQTMQRLQSVDCHDVKTKITISAPKSECSVRKIPIPDEIFHMIINMKCSSDTFFLTGLKYVYVEPRTMQNRFKAILKKCRIDDANFHSLRHTFATRCVELGFDVKSLSEILGHASVNITLNRYVHPTMEQKKKNMAMLSDLIAVS